MAKKKTQNTENQDSVNEAKNQPSFQVQFDVTYGGMYVTKSGESLTVPDMNLTVRQLLNNHSRGLSNDRHLKEPIYFDMKIPKLKDIVDVYEYRDYLKEQQKSVQKFLDDNEKLQAEEAKAAASKIEKEKFKQLRLDEEAEKKKEA